jgi:hypothetical protein
MYGDKSVLEYLKIGIANPAFSRFKKKIINPLAGTEKVRHFNNPNDDMRRLHQRFYGYLRLLKVPLPHSTAVRAGCQPIKNVWPHRRNRYFYLLDLKDFYPNILMSQIVPVICSLAYGLAGREAEVEKFLADYCFAPEGGLRVGAPSSPDIANLVAGVWLDTKLGELAKKYSLVYTRYLDDLTFSGKEVIGEKKRRTIRQVIINTGFVINHRKCAVHDLKKGPLIITGIKLELGGRTMLNRNFLRTVRGLMHLSATGRADPSYVYGRMGCFFSSIMRGGHHYNQTERKLLMAYDQFRQGIKDGSIVNEPLPPKKRPSPRAV